MTLTVIAVVVGVNLLLTLLLALFYLMRYQRQELERMQMQEQLKNLQGDLRSLSRSTAAVGERVALLEQATRQVELQQQQLQQRQTTLKTSNPEEASFEQALKLARKGASEEELMDLCHVSRGEAKLIRMMQR
ncbi:MAG: DUF2802 domain-containing protein [Gammaproteobacteria bacterium]|nr:DUF2802 domain-containing protein [Gammaproteobacteria bacterium]